jgi:hypothetical protein
MITVHVEFGLVDVHVEHVINWMVGWLYREGYIFGYQKYEGGGEWQVDVYARRVCRAVKPVDAFDLALELAEEMYCFLGEVGNLDVAISICGDEGCIDVDWDDVKRLREEEHEGAEIRWNGIADMIMHGKQ